MGGAGDTRDERPTKRDARATTLERPGSESPAPKPRGHSEPALADVLRGVSHRLVKHSTAGKGGFGSIEVALDQLLQRRLAVKVVHSELHQDEFALQLFAREAMITAQLDHPNIVPVHDFGCDDENRIYFTMKLVDGRSLSEVLDDQQGQPRWELLRERVEIVIKLCDALSFAHSRGVIHCDVKSSNVMVGDFGQVYLMDWGAAKLMEGSAVTLEGPLREAVGPDALRPPTASEDDACVLGTPAYMSPEQAAGDRANLDPRADIFSLGAILYEIATGNPPYTADSSAVLMASARAAEVAPLNTADMHAVPAQLERIIMKALAANREDRYASADALRDALVSFARSDSSFPKVRFEAGDEIIREGDEGDATYVVVSGRCEVFQNIDGHRRSIRHMGPGEVFGEAALLTDGPRTASVVATEPTSLLVIARAEFDAEVGALKPWLARVLRTLATRFRESELARVRAESKISASDAPSE